MVSGLNKRSYRPAPGGGCRTSNRTRGGAAMLGVWGRCGGYLRVRRSWAANEICTGARGTRRFASVAICRRSPPTHPYWGAERSGSSSSRVVQLARVLRPAICRCCPEEREPPGSVWIHRNWSNLWHPMRFRKASMSTNASSTSSAQAWTGASQALTTSERLQKTLREASELLGRSHRRIVAWDELFC